LAPLACWSSTALPSENFRPTRSGDGARAVPPDDDPAIIVQ
jgi:hypothetical protein